MWNLRKVKCREIEIAKQFRPVADRGSNKPSAHSRTDRKIPRNEHYQGILRFRLRMTGVAYYRIAGVEPFLQRCHPRGRPVRPTEGSPGIRTTRGFFAFSSEWHRGLRVLWNVELMNDERRVPLHTLSSSRDDLSGPTEGSPRNTHYQGILRF